MIAEENQRELQLITDMYVSNPPIVTPANEPFIVSLTYDAMEEAITSAADLDDGIYFILMNYHPIQSTLMKVVADKFPDKLERLKKLLVLT